MKSIIGEWISSLAIIAILAALVDMILPNSNLRKYTDFLFGLAIIAMFLHPLLLMVGQSVNLETAIFQNSAEQFNKSATYVSSQTEKNQKENLDHYIKSNLEMDLSLQLEYKTGLNIDQINIIFGQLNGETDYSNIQRIDIYTSLHSQQIQIDSIVINSKDDSKDSEINEKKLKIIEVVSELFYIEPGLVNVHIN